MTQQMRTTEMLYAHKMAAVKERRKLIYSDVLSPQKAKQHKDVDRISKKPDVFLWNQMNLILCGACLVLRLWLHLNDIFVSSLRFCPFSPFRVFLKSLFCSISFDFVQAKHHWSESIIVIAFIKTVQSICMAMPLRHTHLQEQRVTNYIWHILNAFSVVWRIYKNARNRFEWIIHSFDSEFEQFTFRLIAFIVPTFYPSAAVII